MWKGFCHLLKKDSKMMLSGRFFLLVLSSLALYSSYINFFYVNLEQENFQVCLYDPQNVYAGQSKYITRVSSRKELEAVCADRMTIGADFGGGTPRIYMLSSGIDTIDHYREVWAEMVLSGKAVSEEETVRPDKTVGKGETVLFDKAVNKEEMVRSDKTVSRAERIGLYNKEQRSRREIAAEFLFFEISAVGFLGLASLLFKEKQMGVIRVHGILPVSKSAFILSKLSLFVLSDLAFTILLTWINVGIADSLSILPPLLIQAGILSMIMAFVGFFCAVRLPDFKLFSLFYLVLAVFITTPVFLAGQTGISWKWISYHPMYHLFMAIKSAYFGSMEDSLPYYLISIGTIAALYIVSCYALSHEMTKEG